MKTFFCWCAANVGIIGIIQVLFLIGKTCLFCMDEVRYLNYAPIILCLFSLFFIYPWKDYSKIAFKFLLLFGGFVYICYASHIGPLTLSPEAQIKIRKLLWVMLMIGNCLALLVTVYVWKNFSEVTSRRMLYRNSSVDMFNIRLNYCIYQYIETLTVVATVVIVTAFCFELKPLVVALTTDDHSYWLFNCFDTSIQE